MVMCNGSEPARMLVGVTDFYGYFNEGTPKDCKQEMWMCTTPAVSKSVPSDGCTCTDCTCSDHEKPAVGVMPSHLWRMHRIYDLIDSICAGGVRTRVVLNYLTEIEDHAIFCRRYYKELTANQPKEVKENDT